MSDKSAFRISMELTRAAHGPLSSRECLIAETAARTAYACACRELAKLAMEQGKNAGG